MINPKDKIKSFKNFILEKFGTRVLITQKLKDNKSFMITASNAKEEKLVLDFIKSNGLTIRCNLMKPYGPLQETSLMVSNVTLDEVVDSWSPQDS